MIRVRLLILALLIPASASRAELVEFTFEGNVTDESAGTPPLPYAPIQKGDPFKVKYVFESTTPVAYGSPDWGLYVDAIKALSVDVGGIEDTAAVPGWISVRLPNKPMSHEYLTSSMALTSSPWFVFVQWFDPSASVFADNRLPLTLDPTRFEARNVVLWCNTGSEVHTG